MSRYIKWKESAKRKWEYAKKYIGAWFIANVIERTLLRLILKTCKIDTCGIAPFVQQAKNGPVLLMCWHNRLNLFAYAIEKWGNELNYAVVISNSGDGEILGAVVERHSNMKAIRVAHDARHQALRAILKSIKVENRVIAITPDGPRGPRYQSKPGAVIAAKNTAANVIAVSWSASKFWQLKSWDKMLIPKPFSRIFFGLSPSQQLSKGESVEELQHRLDTFLCSWDKQVCQKITSDDSQWPK